MTKKLTIYKFEVTNWSSGVTFEIFIKGINVDDAYNKALKKFKYPLYRNLAIL